MCGIIGYAGTKNAHGVLIDGLKALEYRGYDSSGLAVFTQGKINTVKAQGKIKNLEALLKEDTGTCGIAHTRWATHGEANVVNAHPHTIGMVTLVHNGIIENANELRQTYQQKGIVFASDTDTETIAALINDFVSQGMNKIEACLRAGKYLKGSYALAILFADEPDTIYAMRKDSPLILGLSDDGNYVASDVSAFLKATITYVSQILNGILRLVMIFQTMTRGVASIHRVEEVLTCEPIITDGQAQCDLNAGSIEFKHVSFAYPNSREMVLHDLNLCIQPGETLGILGATGSGKSSLVNLIPRFYDVNEGEVLVDGINVKDYPLDKLRGKVAIALQKSELFTTSIKENIAWGNPEASDEEIIQAAAAAQAFEFIENTPDGFETMVTEQGMSLSGGQKQRLAISRDILKNAPILILDDATSALDLKTEANLYQALNKHYNRMTKIIIAQRITSVQGADRIALIENGTLAACDTHEKLLKENQLYQDIYNSQLKGGAFCE